MSSPSYGAPNPSGSSAASSSPGSATATAQRPGLDPAESVAYADSTSDLPLLEAAGFPVAVNPEARLSALARKRGWLVEHFDKAEGGSHPLLPIGPAWRAKATVGRSR